MLKLASVGALILWLVSGCASLPPECKTEYAGTLSHCPAPPPRPPNPAECREMDGVPVYQNNQYAGCMNRDELRDLIRSLPRPN